MQDFEMQHKDSQHYIVCRHDPNYEDLELSFLDRTDDAHRQNRSAKTRYTQHMIGLVAESSNVMRLIPIEPSDTPLSRVLDLLALGHKTEQLVLEGHVWCLFGPLTSEEMEILGFVALHELLKSNSAEELLTTMSEPRTGQQRHHLRVVEQPSGPDQLVTE